MLRAGEVAVAAAATGAWLPALRGLRLVVFLAGLLACDLVGGGAVGTCIGGFAVARLAFAAVLRTAICARTLPVLVVGSERSAQRCWKRAC